MKFFAHCCHCGNKFETESKKAKYCSWLCKKIEITKAQFPDGSDYVECKICGLRGKQIIQHITKVHKMTINEYCKKFNVKYEDLQTKSLSIQMSTNIKKACAEGRCGFQKGGYNPSKEENCRNGRNSAWSMNFHKYDGLSNEEKIAKIKELSVRAQTSRNIRHNNTTKIDYYLTRGYTMQDAKKALRERQRTFTVEKCIAKYGKEKGLQIYEDRQKRWQNTMKSKPIEEIERINKAKLFSNRRGFSIISQELFENIVKQLHGRYKKIHYATITPGRIDGEYMVYNEYTKTTYFLDFYIEDNNKVIEFDGDYWHGEKRGNQKRDIEREINLKKLGYKNIMHVKERDYRTDPDAVIAQCIKFIEESDL